MQGFNMGRYVPPDLEGVASFNRASNTRPRTLPSKDGTLTVRFEMPYPIWCTTCPKETIIGQGVRFNASKKRIGSYFSTPIFSFTIKHTVCGGSIEIHTDPKNTAYVVVSGAKKRDLGEERDGLREGEVVIGGKTEEEKRRLEGDPFARLEEKVKDTTQAATEKTRIQELYRSSERDWSDPGEVNRRLRKAFRVERKVRNERAEATEALQERIGFGGEILEGDESDKRRAQLVDFGQKNDTVGAASRPLFRQQEGKSKGSKAAKITDQQKEALARDLRSNTRVAMDPFLQGDKSDQAFGDVSTLLKRKRGRDPIVPSDTTPSTDLKGRTAPQAPPLLVDYDSD